MSGRSRYQYAIRRITTKSAAIIHELTFISAQKILIIQLSSTNFMSFYAILAGSR